MIQICIGLFAVFKTEITLQLITCFVQTKTKKQRLKQKFCLCRSTDRYDTDPGSQVTYHDGHKIAFSLWRKSIRTKLNVEFWRLKKLLWKLKTSSVFLKVPIKSMSPLFLALISILVNGIYFWFFLFVNTRHDHELIRLKH